MPSTPLNLDGRIPYHGLVPDGHPLTQVLSTMEAGLRTQLSTRTNDLALKARLDVVTNLLEIHDPRATITDDLLAQLERAIDHGVEQWSKGMTGSGLDPDLFLAARDLVRALAPQPPLADLTPPPNTRSEGDPPQE